MENKEIIRQLRRTASLMEINGINEFKVRAINNAIFNLERVEGRLEDMSPEDLQGLKGVGKSIAEQIAEIIAENESVELRKLLTETPKGVVEMMSISGIGAKKIRMLWQEEHITSPVELKKAIREGRLLNLKGFGEKTIQQINESLDYYLSNKHKLLISEALILSKEIAAFITKDYPGIHLEESGAVRRRDQVVSELLFLVKESPDVFEKLKDCDILEYNPLESSPFNWRGIHKSTGMHVRFRKSRATEMIADRLITTGPATHISVLQNAVSLKNSGFESEESVYAKAGFNFVPPDVRVAKDVLNGNNKRVKDLITSSDIRGILHAHSTYSDGQNSIQEMAEACKAQGYEYLGITDHSKSSFFYANGLFENRVKEQFEEIDQLQKKLDGFTLFKGIECDILTDGSLDYSNDLLREFDFVIISVHSVLHMDIQTATRRLVKAIENPYSMILGHLTGRLLLRRQGYPLNMPMILDACRQNGVSIEINANPRRLDIDWTYLDDVIEKEIKISINPDAHNIKGISDVAYGVMAARKGLVTPKDNLTSMSASDLGKFFKSRI